MPYGTVQADVIQSSVPGVSLGAGNATVFKNRIINGDMRIDQRNAGASITPAATTLTYNVDRWCTYQTQASKFTIQQNAGSVTPPVGFTNYLGATSSSAYSVTSTDQFNIRQYIEGFNFADLGFGTANAKTITLSFWVYSSLTGTFGGSFTNYAFTRSYPFTYTISSANTWTQISVTIAGDTSGTWVGATNAGAAALLFNLGCGSTLSGTAGAWASAAYCSATGATSVVGTSGATFYITGVQLEVGSLATGFEYNDYGRQLAQCQRYFQVVTTMSGGTATTVSFQGAASLFVTMRATPSISGTTARVSNLTSSDYTATSPGFATFETMGLNGGRMQVSGFSGLVAGQPMILLSGGTSAAPILFSAEL